MNRTANNSNFWRTVIQAAALTWLVSASASLGLAQSNASTYPTGVRNSRGAQRLSENQLQTIQQSLRQKSGFAELGFDAQGALTLGARNHVAGGSATARALLVAAVDSANLYELASYERSPEVAFARICSREVQVDGSRSRTEVYQVQVDFADFDYLAGACEAKASFDVGIVLLHELVHGVLKLQDPQGGINQIGECDAHVNQMRRELRLPERVYYHPNITVVQTTARRIVSANLEFVERAERDGQPQAKYRLNWLPGQVSPSARYIAQLQQGVVMPKKR